MRQRRNINDTNTVNTYLTFQNWKKIITGKNYKKTKKNTISIKFESN